MKPAGTLLLTRREIGALLPLGECIDAVEEAFRFHDFMEIPIRRTGAATAVAATHLARSDSTVATTCGCGNQGRVQLRALVKVCRLDRVHVFDAEEGWRSIRS